jgi:competence protein ComEC
MSAIAELGIRAEPLARNGTLLLRLVEAQRGRWKLWLAPILLAGVIAYFALPMEPPLWAGPAALIASFSAWFWFRDERLVAPILIAIAALAAGITAAQLRTAATGTPILEGRIGPVMVQGRVVEVTPLPEQGGRVLLEDLSIPRLDPEKTPRGVRLRISSDLSAITPGDRITVLAELVPPPPPAAPGAFDFQRQAWFDGIGGVGFALGEIRAREPAPGASGLAQSWARLRHVATGRILAALPGPRGAIAAALMTGDQGAIPNAIVDAMRDSGLAHLLSISGLHIGLVAGILLIGLRAGLALVPWLALRLPSKKVAAVAALIATGGYVMLAGAPVPAQRAFVMSAIVMLAILTDRSALTMRLIAWAAAVVALLRPEAVLGASFQMSFAAVTALIAAHEALAKRRYRRGPRTLVSRLFRELAGVALTSLVAGTATAPFAAYHFHRLADYGVLANLIAVPITGFWVMPLAILAFALMPLGLEELALMPMGWGIGAIIAVAEGVAAFPGAAIEVPAVSAAALAAVVIGGLWLCLMRGRWRWLGLAVLPVTAFLIVLDRPPDLLIATDGSVVALRDREGYLRLSDTRKGGIAVESWLEGNGQRERLAWSELKEEGGCDSEGCHAQVRDRSIGLSFTPAAAAEDCGRVDLVLTTRFLARDRCPGSVLIDRGALWRAGAHALWITSAGVRIETVRGYRGERPWVAERARPPGLLAGTIRWRSQ